MKLKLEKTVLHKNKRLGQGYGSGKGGHTSSRGQKGQKARGSLGILFEGVKVKKSFFKRLPLLRGKGKFAPNSKVVAVGVSKLAAFGEKDTVTLSALIEKGIVPADTKKVKVFNDAKGSKTSGPKFSFDVPTTKSFQSKSKK